MTFTPLPLLTTGDWIDAAWGNTYWRDNFSAVWPYTTAGDLAYASASNALSRLGIGAAGSLLRSTGSAPAWLGVGSNYQFLQMVSGAPAWGSLSFCTAYHSTTQNVSNATATALAFDSDLSDVPGWHNTSSNNSRITVDAAGYYIAVGFLEYSGAGGSGTYFDSVDIYKNGGRAFGQRHWVEVNAFTKSYCISSPVIDMQATDYFQLYLEQNSGGTRTVAASARFSVWRVR